MRTVFIGGCERSGTTLLGSLLGGHPDCLCTPESQFRFSVLRDGNSEPGALDLSEAFNHMQHHWRFKLWEIDIDPVPTILANPTISYRQLLEYFVEVYGRKHEKANPAIWVDHTPANVRYAAAQFKHFPDLRMIHLIRDGRAVANSVMRVTWGPNTIIRAAHWWLEKLSYGLALETSQYGDKVLRVKYEDLVRAPEETLKCICHFLDIDFKPEMVQGRGFKVPQYTSKQHQLVGKGADQRRSGAWRSELTPRQIEIFESLTCDLLDYLGYEVVYGYAARVPTRVESLSARIVDSFNNKLVKELRQQRRTHKALRAAKDEA